MELFDISIELNIAQCCAIYMHEGKANSYSTQKAADYSGLTSYMVEYLCRNGVIMPSGAERVGRGKKRYFSFGDVVMLRTIKRLLEAGMSTLRLRASLAELRVHHPMITRGTLPGNFLCTDGKNAYFIKDKRIENLNEKGQYEFRFIIDMMLMRHEVQNRISGEQRSVQRRRPIRKATI